MNILLLEDEQPAADRLVRGLRKVDPSIVIHGPLRSVAEGSIWLDSHPSPDLIIADIQLADGLSLEIFRSRVVTAPVIFATAYDAYWMEALQANGIEYLLKPVRQERLEGALEKFHRLREHFGGVKGLIAETLEGRPRTAQRIVVRKGGDFVAIPYEQIACFVSEHKVVFLVEADGHRSLVDRTLGELETMLPREDFFRVNRQVIARVTAIKRFRPFEKGKLRVQLHQASAEVIVSQENAGRFKDWMDGR